MRTVAGLDQLYEQAALVTGAGSRSFYFATRFFPHELSRSAHAIYWFCRHTDDLVDECATAEQGRRDLEEWASALERTLSGETPADPILQVFQDTMMRFQIPHEYPRELLEGMRMDLDCVRYESFPALRVFCYRVASVVGLMMSHIIGFRPGALEYAVDLGIAMQLTNILRDVGEDLRRGRIYLPADEMRMFGYTEADLRAHAKNRHFLELMKFQVARARRYYQRALPGIELLDPAGRFAVRIAADVYCEILGQIERSGYDVFENRAVVPATRKYWISARAMAAPAARHYVSRLWS
jgi:phytoene synthase